MENSNDNSNESYKDPALTSQDEDKGADGPSLPHEPVGTPEDAVPVSEDAADHGTRELEETEHTGELEGTGQTGDQEVPETDEDARVTNAPSPSDEPGPELSSDEVRTALVAIRGQNRSAHFNAGEHSLKPGDEVVIQTEQGKAIGEILEPPVVLGCRGCKHLTILRKATPEEISRDEENRDLEKKAFEYCTKTIEEWEIPMRLVQVEFHLDRSKSVFYFTAEKRVDFRELVRTLAREFSTRIEMRQIGIRDEARLLGGVGPCGMAFCCSTFLKEFAPISVKMAKEQNVILNPTKISGGCGRLLCCLNYEYDQYREASRGVPRIGKKINIPEGSGKVRSVDIFARTVTIDMTDDKPLVIDIDELREKMK